MDETPHCEHGVFLSVLDIGLLIRGNAGIGKSTLALELIERGHRFISDDVVHFTQAKDLNQNRIPDQIMGKSPHMLKDLLAVRDLGVLNISDLFSADICLPQYPLELIVELVRDECVLKPTLTGTPSHLTILNHRIPVQLIHAHPKRNLSVIVETAIKNYILYNHGQDAGTLLEKRQQYLFKTS